MAKIRVELEINVEPMTEAEMLVEGFAADSEDDSDEIDAREIAECLAGLFYENSDFCREMLAGTNLFVKLGDAVVVRAEVA